MPETILVIEYEPRYTDRVQQALSGQPFTPSFARDGDEALRAIASEKPRLIVLSSVVPKTTTADLIRAIRSQPVLQKTPILLTVSGYAGTTPQADAQRVGASDILPKPYSDSEFLGKVQQLLGIAATQAPLRSNPDYVIRATAPTEPGHLTSDDIFSDVLEEERTVVTRPRKISRATGDVDKMIADTLAGVMPPRKTSPGVPKPATLSGGTPTPKPRSETGSAALDKIVHDTLSGLERTPPRAKSAPPPTSPAVPPSAAPAPAPASAPSAPAQTAPPQPQSRPAAPAPPASPAAGPARAAVVKSAAPPADDSFGTVVLSQPILAPPAPPPAEEEEPIDGVKFGQYVLLEKIATGGMAEVWKARMRGVEGFQKTVAIKKILPHLSDDQDFIEMFIDEAKLAAQLTHNNIIHIYDLGKIQSSYYIAMEYVDGWDLKTILKKAHDRDQPITVEIALFVASKIASALDYAHRRRDFNDKDLGLVHRDVSPQNVLISQEGDIKLCDFGIAKAASKASHTQNGALKGKLQYMSPEQAWGQTIDRRADVFALATVLFEMLTGKKLFTGESELSILEQVREARVTPPSQWNDEVTPEIDAVVLKALEKDPGTRYQTAGEMARNIDQILYGMKPTPTSADLAIFMHRLSVPEPVMPKGPDLEETVIAPRPPPPAPAAVARPVAPVAAAPVAVATPPAAAVSRAPFQQALEPKKKSRALPIVIAAILVIAVAAGAFFVMRGRSGSAPDAAAPRAGATVPVATPSTSTTGVVPQTATAAAATTTEAATAATGTAPAVDPAKVEQEVRKRLEAERQKLEQLSRAQQPRPAAAQTQPAAAAAVPPRPLRQTTPPPPAPQVTETHAPVQTATTATQVAETAAPAPPEPAPRVREGDLVTTSEGLTPPRVIGKSAPQYPPIARAQRAQGSVVISVLISETGKVLDMRVISGVDRGFGINESAQQTVRRWTFAPGMKDGVRVKAWTTVRIDFKL